MLFTFWRRSDVTLVAVGMTAVALDAAVEPVSSVLVGHIFDDLQAFSSRHLNQQEFMSRVLGQCMGIWVLAGLSMMFGWLSFTSWNIIGNRQGHRARSLLYDGVMRNSIEWFERHDHAIGKVNVSFKDIQDLEQALGPVSAMFLTAVLGATMQLGVAFYFSWAVTLVCLAGSPVLVVLTSVLSIKVEQRIDEAKSLQDIITQHADWVLRSLTTVLCLRRDLYEKAKLSSLIRKERDVNMSYHRYSAIIEGAGRFIMLSMFVQGFFFGQYMVKYHGLASGSVVTVFWSCLSAAVQFNAAMQHLVELQKGLVSARRLAILLQRDQAEELKSGIGIIPAPSNPCEAEILFDGVVFTYPTRPNIVLAELNLRIAPGETTYIVGPSGSGKSSIASLICKQYEVDQGQVSIDGLPVAHLSKRWIERNVYIVEQQARLFDLPIVENVRLGSLNPDKVTFQEIESVLELIHADFVHKLPRGLLTAGAHYLSGGQKQLIGLARAVLRDAPIMIFDESTSALDPQLRVDVMRTIRQLREHKTTIVITHQLDLVPPDQAVYLVEDGRATFHTSVAAVPAMSIESLKSTFQHQEVEEDESQEKRSNEKMFRSISNKLMLLGGLSIVTIHATLNPLFAFAFSKLIVGVLPGNAVNVTLWALVVLLIAFLDGLCSFFKLVLNIVAENWQMDVRNAVYAKLLARTALGKAKVSYYTKLAFADSEKSTLIISEYWPGIASMLVLAPMAFIWSFVEGWKLSLVALSITPAFLVTTQIYKSLNEYWNGVRESRRSRVLQLLVELVEGAGTVKSLCLHDYFGDLYSHRERAVHRLSTPMSLWLGFAHGLLKLFPLAAQGLLLWYGMRLIATYEYSTEQTMLVFTMLIFALLTLEQVASTIPSVNSGFEAAGRLLDAMTDETDAELEPIVACNRKVNFKSASFCNVTLRFPSGQRILDGFSAEIYDYEKVAIIGPSGIGKSSIARLLLRFHAPTEGLILYDGCDSQSIPSDEVRANVGLVAQMPLDFLDDSIMENLLYSCNDRDLAVKCCMQCGVHEFIMGLDEGYDTRIKNNLLSGGQTQRLGIARALMQKPDMLILDEFTSALDQESSERIMQLVMGLPMTVVIITHQMEIANKADRIISLF